MRKNRPTRPVDTDLESAVQIFHGPRSRSSYTPEIHAAQRWLTYWLNAEELDERTKSRIGYDPPSKERILRLLETVRAALSSKIRVDDEERAELLIENAAITTQMRSYALFPSMAYQPSTGKWSVIRKYATGNPHSVRETLAAHGIIEIGQHQLLARIRQCDCGRWYFARREDGVACRDSCRKRVHERTPQAKATRKARIQENREYTSGKIHLRANAKAAK